MNSIASLFLDDAVDKQIKIEYDGGTITNKDIPSEEIELVERLCSESQLRFGACESATIKFRISNDGISLKDKWLAVTDTLEDDITQLFELGRYKVDSDNPTADRRYRDIIAYDAMYDIINAEVSKWYNGLLPNADSTVTLKQFRTSFLTYLGVNQEVVDLPNDSMTVTKTVDPSTLSGKTVITAICEVNGCFGHIGRDGRFQYIFLTDTSTDIEKGHYITAEYEDYTTEKISKLQIRQEENDIGCIYGSGDNCYIVQDNFLLYGKSTGELQSIAAKLYDVICNVCYRPAHIEAKGNPCLEVGDRITVHTSDRTIDTYILQRTLKGIQALRDTYDAEGEQYQTEKVNAVRTSIIQLRGKTNVLSRTIEETKMQIKDVESGLSNEIRMTAGELDLKIQDLQSEIDGEIVVFNLDYEPLLTNYPAWDWTYNIPVNDTVQLRDDLQFEYKEEYWKKHARTLFFDETTGITYRFEKKDGKWNWYPTGDTEYSYLMQQISEVKVTSENISASVSAVENTLKNDYLTRAETESRIEVTRQGILQTVSADYVTTSLADKTYETKVHAESSYKQTAASIEAEVKRASDAEDSLSSRITQTADSITAEVKRAQGKEDELTAAIKVNADNISSKVTRGNISSEISQEAGKISIKSNRLSIESTYFTLTEDGKIKATNGEFSGKITANSGTIGGMNIDSQSIRYGKTSFYDSKSYGVYIGTDGIAIGSGGASSAFQVTASGDITLGILGDFTLGSGQLNMGLMSTAYISHASSEAIRFESGGKTTIKSRYAILGGYNTYVGFFGNEGALKKTVLNITSTSSATALSVATKLNELLNALRAYNLIG